MEIVTEEQHSLPLVDVQVVVRSGAIADEPGYEGATRHAIELMARGAGPRSRAQIDEAFLTSASRGLIPIVEIADRPVGDGRPGPIHRRLFDAAKRLVEREARPAWPQRDTTSA